MFFFLSWLCWWSKYIGSKYNTAQTWWHFSTRYLKQHCCFLFCLTQQKKRFNHSNGPINRHAKYAVIFFMFFHRQHWKSYHFLSKTLLLLKEIYSSVQIWLEKIEQFMKRPFYIIVTVLIFFEFTATWWKMVHIWICLGLLHRNLRKK